MEVTYCDRILEGSNLENSTKKKKELDIESANFHRSDIHYSISSILHFVTLA